jgi:hypothetical protein
VGKKKHKTPAHLDHLFSRHLIGEDEYREFWSKYWPGSNEERKKWIDFYTKEDVEIEEPVSRKPTHDRKEAERQAKAIGGYVARRNKNGRFSKRGKIYQAIRRRRK